jgi:NAD(P)H-hydrate epimerase
MGAIDRDAPEDVGVLIERAGAATARAALALLGGGYGRRVVVVAGGGNNGADGRAAARRLARRGVRVEVRDAGDGRALPHCDLVIDAAYGTGFRGRWSAPALAEGTPVLAVDIPSGVDGLTGRVGEGTTTFEAEATVTFAALKPGLLLEPGASRAGTVTVADIGLDTSRARCHLVEDDDVAGWLPAPAPDTHKWRAAVWVVAGSPGMDGAAALACTGAQRAGAGYVRLSTPGQAPGPAGHVPVEVVRTALPAEGWWAEVRGGLERFGALVVGPGLGRSADGAHDVRSVVAASPVPVVVDGDGLALLGDDAASLLGPHHVLTPHDGEFERLAGHPPGDDRPGAVRSLSARLGCVVLLKGPCTLVARPDGEVLAVTAGDARLATAGTGDVLAGMAGALCARGLDPFVAAAAAAHVHGRAATTGWSVGLRAGDLADLVPAALAGIAAGGRDPRSAP